MTAMDYDKNFKFPAAMPVGVHRTEFALVARNSGGISFPAFVLSEAQTGRAARPERAATPSRPCGGRTCRNTFARPLLPVGRTAASLHPAAADERNFMGARRPLSPADALRAVPFLAAAAGGFLQPSTLNLRSRQ
jgi:hypothetical protein